MGMQHGEARTGALDIAAELDRAAREGAAGHPAAALACCERILAADPAHVPAARLAAVLCCTLRRFAEAVAFADRSLAGAPDDPETLSNRAVALHELGRPTEAVASADRALALRPNHLEAWFNRGNSLQTLGRLEDALASYDRALALRPGFAPVLRNRGNVLHELGRFAEALASYDRSLAVQPDAPELLLSRALTLLMTGRVTEGLQAYEWRRRQAGWNEPRPPCPEWRGDVVPSQRLLVWTEQGLGDTIQFARFAQRLAERGPEVVLSVQPTLRRLFGSLHGVEVVGTQDPVPACHAHVPLMSLPDRLRLGPDAFGSEPYLSAPAERVAAWRARLPAGFRVGVAWQGQPDRPIDRGRSLPLACLAPLASVPGVRLVSLQRGHGLDQLAGLPDGMAVTELPGLDEGPDGFLDTAAVMASLDLVVTSDTAVAHLAGALGRPVWVALQRVPDWRWGPEGTGTFWYSTMRLFRQEHRGDWAAVAEAMARELTVLREREVAASGTVRVPVSLGELIDKVTILELKAERFVDPGQRANVARELALLEDALSGSGLVSEEMAGLREALRATNAVLWETESRIRACAPDAQDEVARLARLISETNDRRAALKRRINLEGNSALIEEKQYG